MQFSSKKKNTEVGIQQTANMRVPDLALQKCSLFSSLMAIAQPQIPTYFSLFFWRVEGATNSQYIKTLLIRSQLLRFPSGYVIKSRVLYLFRLIIYFSLSLCVPLGCVSVRFYSVRYCSDLCLSSAMHLSVTCYTFCTYTVST